MVPLAMLEPIRSVYDSRSTNAWTMSDSHGIPWFSLQFANPPFFVAAVVLIALGALLYLPPGANDRCRASWLSTEELSLAILLLLIPYVARGYEMGMGSMGRFTAIVFPIYVVVGRLLLLLPGSLRGVLLAVSAYFLATYTGLYVARHAIF